MFWNHIADYGANTRCGWIFSDIYMGPLIPKDVEDT